MGDGEPGPSRRKVRRKTKATPGEIAEMYAKITALDVKTTAMAQASAIRFGEIQQDIDRLDSNSETQRKYIGQELQRVELRTQSAVDQAQQQIDSLRQQTTNMHTSLGAIHHHSETLTEGLKTMMTSFSNLRFELPNTFDSWMRVRTEQAGADNGTVSVSDLHQAPWSSIAGGLPVPSVPPLLPLHRSPSAVSAPPPVNPSAPSAVSAPSPVTPSAPNTEPSCSEPSLHPSSRSPTHSPTDLYHQFMVQEDSDALMDLRKDLDEDKSGMEMEVDGEGEDASEQWEGTGGVAEPEPSEQQEQLAQEVELLQEESSQQTKAVEQSAQQEPSQLAQDQELLAQRATSPQEQQQERVAEQQLAEQQLAEQRLAEQQASALDEDASRPGAAETFAESSQGQSQSGNFLFHS